MKKYNQTEFADYLIDRGIVPPDKVESLLSLLVQKNKNYFLGDLLIDAEILSPEEVRDALAAFLSLKPVTLNENTYNPPQMLLNMLPIEVVEVFRVVPVRMDDDSLYIAGDMIFSLPYLNTISKYVVGRRIVPLIATRADIRWALKRFYNIEKDRRGELFIQAIIVDALSKGASDVHFEQTSQQLNVRYRIDRRLHVQQPIPNEYVAEVIRAIKEISKLDTHTVCYPQQGTFVADTGHETIKVIVSTLPTIHGESIVLHLDRGKR